MGIKPKILSRFLFRRFLISVGLVLFVISGIIFAITFVEKLPQSLGITDAVFTSFVALLEYVPLFLPLAVFMGTLLSSYNLTRSSEGVIVSGAGLSQYKSMKPFIVAAILLGVIASTIINPYSVNLSLHDIKLSKLALIDDAIWLREQTPTGFTTLRATGINKDNSGNFYFKNAVLFIQSDDFKLNERVETKTLNIDRGQLKSDQADIFTTNGSEIKSTKWSTPTSLTSEIILNRYLNPDQISFWKLPHFVLEMNKIGISTASHMVQFWTLLLLPLSLVAMVVLGVAFSQTHERRNYSFGLKFGIGIVASFALYFVTKIFSALGASGELPALLAVSAPPLIIIAMAAIFIVSFDTI